MRLSSRVRAHPKCLSVISAIVHPFSPMRGSSIRRRRRKRRATWISTNRAGCHPDLYRILPPPYSTWRGTSPSRTCRGIHIAASFSSCARGFQPMRNCILRAYRFRRCNRHGRLAFLYNYDKLRNARAFLLPAPSPSLLAQRCVHPPIYGAIFPV